MAAGVDERVHGVSSGFGKAGLPRAHRLVVGPGEHVAARVDERAYGASVPRQRLQALQCAHVPHLQIMQSSTT